MQYLRSTFGRILFFSISLTAYATEKDPEPLQCILKHIEGKGIGYKEGYTSLQMFFLPSHTFTNGVVPVLDARIHVLNNGTPATNIGCGARWIRSRIWGAHGYYDFRRTKKQPYHQISCGMESLGSKWDFRINGYFPVGGKLSAPYDIQFGYFSGHSMWLSRQKEFTLKCVQTEAATHVITIRGRPSYLAFGPYYLNGSGSSSFGGKVRYAFDFFTYLRAEGIYSYDSLFGSIVQGQCGLHIPLGPSRKKKSRLKSNTDQLLHQPIQRNEIIPVSTKTFYAQAINPTTQQPYVFWFVDNTGNSQGTYQSPFPTLIQAQNASQNNQVIYVFPGDGTMTGMDEGLTMKKGQRLLGSSVSHKLPTQQTNGIVSIKIPQQTHWAPLLGRVSSTGENTGIVILSNNCEVAGIRFGSSNTLFGEKLSAVLGGPATDVVLREKGVKNPSIHNNWISGSYYLGGIYLHNSRGTVSIQDNTFQNLTAANAISLFNDKDDLTLSAQIIKNDIESPSGGGIYFQNAQGTHVSTQDIIIQYNTLINILSDAIYIINNGNIAPLIIDTQRIFITNNVAANPFETGVFVLNNKTVSIDNQTTVIRDNEVSASFNGRGIFFDNNGSDMHINTQHTLISNNIISSSSLDSIIFLNYDDLTLQNQQTRIIGNTILEPETVGITFSNSLAVTKTTQNAFLTHNTIDGAGEGAIHIQTYGPNPASPSIVSIRANTIDNSINYGIFIDSFSVSTAHVNISNNTITDTSRPDSLSILSDEASTLCVDILHNFFDQNILFDQQETSHLFVTPLRDNTYQKILGTYTPVPEHYCDCN